LPAALEEFLEYGASRLTEEAEFVLSTVLDENVVRLEIVDCDGAIPESDFQSISHDRETQLDHADGLEPWLIRWAVVYSDGEIRVLDGDRRGLCIRLQRADT
jgi:hypothetical protein